MAKILLELDGMSLMDAEYAIIKKVIGDNPKMTCAEIAEILGTSERSLYRYIKEYGIKKRKAPHKGNVSATGKG